jgi:hypothetical protein
MARFTSEVALDAVAQGQVRTPSQLYGELLRAAAIASLKYRGKVDDRFIIRVVERLLPAAAKLYVDLLKTHAHVFVQADRDYRVGFEANLDNR